MSSDAPESPAERPVQPHRPRAGTGRDAIAAHKVADAQRSFSRSAVPVDEFPEQMETSPNPEEQVIAVVDRRLANQLLDRLPVRMREVLVLRALGMSAEVIGQHLDMTANAVRVTQHRASGKLRRPPAAGADLPVDERDQA